MNEGPDDRGPHDVRDRDNGEESPGGEGPPSRTSLKIRIDRREYQVPPDLLDAGHLTGRQIRRLADPDIGADRDLFEVVPGGSDRKIDDGERILIRNHMRFFSAPSVINPGSVSGPVASRPRGDDSASRGGRDAAQ